MTKNKNKVPIEKTPPKKKKGKPKKFKHPPRSTVKVSENEWFKRKFQREFNIRLKDVSVAKITEKYTKRLRKRKKRSPHEEPTNRQYPDIAWDGSRLKTCYCLSHMHHCDCQECIVLPRRSLPYGINNKLLPFLRRHRKLLRIENMNLDLPEKPFPVRLMEHIDIEKKVEQKLKEMDTDRGLEFCIMRCHHRFKKEQKAHPYFTLKQDLYYNFKHPKIPKPVPPPPKKKPVVRGPWISDSFTEGYYRTGGTQALTDKNGDFIFGEISHILFGRYSSYFQDIEGIGLCLNSYQEKPKEKVIKQIGNLLSSTRIMVSKLTSNFMTSIIEIKDPGIPMNTVATQDPPLDDDYVSIITPSKTGFIREVGFGGCLPCKDVQETKKEDPSDPDPNTSTKDVNKTDDSIDKPKSSENDKEINENGNKDIPDPEPKDSNIKNESESGAKKQILLVSTAEENDLDHDNNKNGNDKNKKDVNEQNDIKDSKVVLEVQNKNNKNNDDVNEEKVECNETKSVAFININNQRQSCPAFSECIKSKDQLCNDLDPNVPIDQYIASLFEEMLISGLEQVIRKEEVQLHLTKYQKSSDDVIHNKIRNDILKIVEKSVLSNVKSDTSENFETDVTNIIESTKSKLIVNILLEFVRKNTISLRRKFKGNNESLQSRIRMLFRMEDTKLKINNMFQKIRRTLTSFLKSRQEKLLIVTKDLFKLKEPSLNINRSNDNKSEQNSVVNSGHKLTESTRTNNRAPQNHSSSDILPSNSKK